MSERAPQETQTPRMGHLARLPVFFALAGKRAVVAGGAAPAAWKVELLAAAGAVVHVFAAEVGDVLAEQIACAPDGGVVLHARKWTAADLDGAVIAVADCESEEEAEAFAKAARAAGVPVNIIDKPKFCDFAFGSIVNRSPLVIGISTDGAAPVLAQAIRGKLEALLPQGFARWAEAASRWRSRVKESGLPFAARRKFWHVFTAHAVANPDAAPQDSDFQHFLDEVRGLGAAAEIGSVTLVGAGPGDPELLTLRAVRALQSADVILFDDLVSSGVLDFARREARKMLVGKTGHGPSCKQDEINALMVNLAKSGKRVVRLKGGDPLVFARASEELDACAEAGLSVEVVAGISAAQGAAASLGVPLTGRDRSRRLQFVTGHAKDGELPGDLDWRALADPGTTTAIYMPKRTLESLVSKALAEGLDPATPAVAVISATRPDQQVISAPVAQLPAKLKDVSAGPALVMLGQVFEPQLRGLSGQSETSQRRA